MPNELITSPSDDEPVPAELSAYLRADSIREAINKSLPHGVGQLPAIPKDYVFKRRDKEVVALSLHAAFELCGGVPNLVAWANQNPKDFYNLWVKLMNDDKLDSRGGTTINFVSQVPQSPLDLVNINASGKVYTVDGFEQDDELPE